MEPEKQGLRRKVLRVDEMFLPSHHSRIFDLSAVGVHVTDESRPNLSQDFIQPFHTLNVRKINPSTELELHKFLCAQNCDRVAISCGTLIDSFFVPWQVSNSGSFFLLCPARVFETSVDGERNREPDEATFAVPES